MAKKKNKPTQPQQLSPEKYIRLKVRSLIFYRLWKNPGCSNTLNLLPLLQLTVSRMNREGGKKCWQIWVYCVCVLCP